MMNFGFFGPREKKRTIKEEGDLQTNYQENIGEDPVDRIDGVREDPRNLSDLPAGFGYMTPDQFGYTDDFEMTKQDQEISQSLNFEPSPEDLMTKYNIEDKDDLREIASQSYYLLRNLDFQPPKKENSQKENANKKYSTDNYNDHRRHQELAVYYESLLINDNPAGLPFNKTEWAKLSESEQTSLPELYRERRTLMETLVSHNDSFRRFDRPDLAGNHDLVYSTTENKSVSEVPEYDPKKDWALYQANVKHLSKELARVDKEINSLKNKMTGDPSFDDVPKYSEEDIRLQEECLDFLRIRDKREANERELPKMLTGDELNKKNILQVAQEGAWRKIQEDQMDKGVFAAEEFNGRRQLFFIDQFPDPQTKQIKYVKYFLPNQILPVGKYAFEPDYGKMFVSKNNSNFSFIRVKLLVTLENIEEFGQKLKKQVEAGKNE